MQSKKRALKYRQTGRGTYSVIVIARGGERIVITEHAARDIAFADAADILVNGLRIYGGRKFHVMGLEVGQFK